MDGRKKHKKKSLALTAANLRITLHLRFSIAAQIVP